MSNPTWFEVAKRPKWIAGLFFSLAVAAIFSLLGQWQLSRTFQVTEVESPSDAPLVLIETETPGQPMTAAVANKIVEAEIFLDLTNVYVVANRVQQVGEDKKLGYWLIANSSALLSESNSTASLTVALGFSTDLVQIEQARAELMNSVQIQAFEKTTGRYIQTEAPLPFPESTKPYLLDSLSLAQLVNLYSDEPVRSFAGILVSPEDLGLGIEPISFLPPQPGTSINWLTLFYAVEWVLFAGFALFLWWRLVEDQRVREQK